MCIDPENFGINEWFLNRTKYTRVLQYTGIDASMRPF
jgi:hypothetical protein